MVKYWIDLLRETYQYYDLPFCQPSTGLNFKILGFGEVMDANRMAQTLYRVPFLVEKTEEHICSKRFEEDELAELRNVSLELLHEQIVYLSYLW